MNQRHPALSVFAALLVMASASTVFAQEAHTQRPIFERGRSVSTDNSVPPATPLVTWKGSFAYHGTNNFVMVGTNPATSNASTTIPVFIIPMTMSFTKSGKTTVFSPVKAIGTGLSAAQQTVASPIFQSSVDYVQGGTDIGKTQYEDAFQRGNFWTDVMTNTNYHVLLGKPKILAPIAVSVPTADGTTGTSTYGPPGTLGIVSYSWFTQEAPTWIAKYPQITPSALAIFITYNVYLSETNNFGGCCIGGYHNAYGNASSQQTYAQFSFMGQSSARDVFSSDVSALSHEIGEWMDDPYVDNVQGACGGILEDGDPLEGNADYGDTIYTIGGYQYHIQDLVFLKYFGQTPSTSVNDWWTFQGYPFTQVCQNGQ
jgi:hypothetical protein